MGAWIEILYLLLLLQRVVVAPRVGAWIEINIFEYRRPTPRSPPAWGRGLKYNSIIIILLYYLVAPRVGAWIEISVLSETTKS